MLGIDKTLEVFDDMTKLLVSGVLLYNNGVGFNSFRQLWDIADALKELVLDLPGALPEIMDLDASESSRLGEAAHKMLTEVSEAFSS